MFNAFGSIDNLAWIWVSEKELDIYKLRVGLGPKRHGSKIPRNPAAFQGGHRDRLVRAAPQRQRRVGLYAAP